MKLKTTLFSSLLGIAFLMGGFCDGISSDRPPERNKLERKNAQRSEQPTGQNTARQEVEQVPDFKQQAEEDIKEGEKEAKQGNPGQILDRTKTIINAGAALPKRDYTYHEASVKPGLDKKVLPTIPASGDLALLPSKSLDENKRWLRTKADRTVLLQCRCLVDELKKNIKDLPQKGPVSQESLQPFLSDMLKTSDKIYQEILDGIEAYKADNTKELRVKVLQDILAASGYCGQPFGMLKNMIKGVRPQAQFDEPKCIALATVEGRVK